MTLGIVARVSGSFAQIMEQHAADGRHAVTKGVHGATTDLKDTFRGQVRANFKSRKLPTTWQEKKFPSRAESLGAAGLVFSRSPEILLYYTKGQVITAGGGRSLAIPTGFNVARGRRGREQVRVTPRQMVATGKAFVIPSKTNPNVRLWCLPLVVLEFQNRRGRAANSLRLATGSRADDRAGLGLTVGTGKDRFRAARRKQLIKQRFVPMFLLLREVTRARRVDLDGPVAATDKALPQRIVNSWRDGAGKPRPIRRSL